MGHTCSLQFRRGMQGADKSRMQMRAITSAPGSRAACSTDSTSGPSLCPLVPMSVQGEQEHADIGNVVGSATVEHSRAEV